MGKWPAVDLAPVADPDLPLAIVDDYAPTAVESGDNRVRIYFPTTTARDAACAALGAARYCAEPVDVDDEDWARRSQENLQPITVGRITIVPSPRGVPQVSDVAQVFRPAIAPASSPESPVLVIQPSMGFGTGHHATTRLCLSALQAVDLTGRVMLDVGTGSGILAIAAVRLGAAAAMGVDYDADAIRAANDNLALNPGLERIAFRVADLSSGELTAADVVAANLTGAALIRSARRLVQLVRPGGSLIVSGLLMEERDDVLRAFDEPVSWEQHEDGWAGLAMKRS